ncbi:VOC family protein [Aureimonas pseudogalii]|uniref:Catechol 2,3-dioxygenase-like lactoylglutathione lyase family enzyme n=1 Tax=Aureimonas pseudogalii TaxID=1744844 RepID=A0A7W6H503_9HYPH|nr:VOC family protein [Aureimonas pseudogalii]MBB3998675.1 catechol 2,3-dioxygenase-like lactoylglutathione lyase family enzyme [Aureimonas pseudogalii]
MTFESGLEGREVDHVVLAVDSLDEARRWFENFGFLVAPDALHPFGTANACIFLADGCYVELLAVGDAEAYERALREGATFVRHDASVRADRAMPCLSGIALRSEDAAADRDRLVAKGLSEGDLFDFGRDFQQPDGTRGRVSFSLAFAQSGPAEPLLFFCQPTGDRPDRSVLTRHPNGACGLAGIVLDPERLSPGKLDAVRGGTYDHSPFRFDPSDQTPQGDARSGLVFSVAQSEAAAHSYGDSATRHSILGSGAGPFLIFEDIP